MTASTSGPYPLCGLTFVKFHQVGGTTVSSVLSKAVSRSPNPAMHASCAIAHRFSHKPGFEAMRLFVSLGTVPSETQAVTIFRHPVEKYLSAFYKHEFRAGVDDDYNFNPHPATQAWITQREAEGMLNATAVDGAIRARLAWTVARAGRAEEYSSYLRDSSFARGLLSKFAVVGLLEDTERFFARLCALLQLPRDACKPAEVERYNQQRHRLPPRPRGCHL